MSNIEFVEWYMTDQCFLNCQHCFNKSSQENEKIDCCEIKEIATKIANASPRVVNVSGGDPLILDEIFEVLDIFKHKNIPLTLSTSGWRNDATTILKVIENVHYGVQLSLDAANKDIHDTIRRKNGAFEHAVSFINQLRKQSDTYDIQICMTLNKLNQNELRELYKLASFYKINTFKIQSLYPIGRALEHDELFLTDKELEDALLIIKELKEQKGLNIFYNDPLWNLKSYLKNNQSCKMISIEPNKDIKIMPYLPFVFGNMENDDFLNLYNKKMVRFFESQMFQEFYKNIYCATDLYGTQERMLV